jgi:hypothetical protein
MSQCRGVEKEWIDLRVACCARALVIASMFGEVDFPHCTISPRGCKGILRRAEGALLWITGDTNVGPTAKFNVGTSGGPRFPPFAKGAKDGAPFLLPMSAIRSKAPLFRTERAKGGDGKQFCQL